MTGAQYTTLKRVLCALLSGSTYGPAPQTPETTMLSFFSQLFAASSGAAALSSAEQTQLRLFLRSVLADTSYAPSDADVTAFFTQLNIDALGLAQLPSLQYRILRDVLRATLCDNGYPAAPGDNELLSLFGAYYNWQTDQQILARFKAGSLTDLAYNSAWGNLTVQGGSLTTTANLIDGNAAWQFTKGAGVRLVTTSTALIPGPHHIIVVCRSTTAGGAPANNDTFVGDGGNGTFGTRIQYNTGTQLITISGGAFGAFVCTPTNWNLLNGYQHASAGRTSTNGAAYVTAANGTNNALNGITIGAFSDGTNGAGCDIAEVIVIAGQASAQLMAGIHAYMRATYPSLGLPANPPATFSVDQTTLSQVTAPFDFILTGGQSNNGNNCTGATQTPAANTYLFDSANTFSAMRLQYDNAASGLIDTVQSHGTGGGGNATSLANTYVATTGRPLVVVPCASGGSAMSAAGAGGNPWNIWDPSAYGGRSLKLRDTLYGSMLARARNMIALGGRFRFLWWYQGEDEAINALTATHAALTLAFFNQFFADWGQPQRIIIQPIANTVSGASGPNIAAIQAGQASLALAGSRLVGTPYNGSMEADNLHVNASGCDTIGTAAANLALAQPANSGWY